VKRLIQFMVSMTFLTLSAFSYAQNATLEAVDVFPVSQSVLDSTDAPISVIETAEIADSQGRVARGPHDVIFSLTDDAPYAIKIGGKRIEPGSSITLTIDLTRVDHRLQMPVFPAENGKYGKVDYKLSIPNLNIKICPNGFQERPEDCYKIEFREINYICPASFTYSSSIEACRRQVNLELVNDCPDGFSRGSGDTCSRTTTSEIVEYCDDDSMSIEGDACIKRAFTDTMACPETYSRDDSGRCVKITQGEPAQSCPDGFLKSANTCKKLTQVDPVDWACPSSHPNRADDSESCFATQPGFEEFGSAESELSCGSGYTFEDSRCVQYTEPTYQCPRGGYNTENDACEYTIVKPESNYCGGVEVESETCKQFDYKEVGVYCKPGFNKQSDNSCMKLESAPVQDKCQSGYSMNGAGTACVKTETLTLDIKCPSGYARSDDGAYCYKTDQMNAYENCATGYTNIGGGVCEKVENQAAAKTCPSGYSLSNGRCEKSESQPSDPACPKGYSISGGACKKTTSTNPVYSCEQYSWIQGYELSGDKCVRQDRKKGKPLCPAGWVPYANYTYERPNWTEYECFNENKGGDERLIPVEDWYCPDGYSKAGDWCNKPEFAEASITCPNDYSLSGGTCKKTQTTSPSSQCPNGWVLQGDYCKRTVSTEVNYSCMAGWTLQGDSCTRTIDSDVDYSCPSDDKWTLNNTKCDFYDEDPLVISCPDTFAYNSSTDACERVDTQPAILGCADGFSLTEDKTQCFRETIVPHL